MADVSRRSTTPPLPNIDASARSGDTPPGLLRNRNFILLWLAYGISAMGDHISEMAILKTQDALDPTVDVTPLTARMTFMFFLPFFLLAPVAGALADRLPRRSLMVFSDIARALILLGFGTLIALTSSWGIMGPFMPLLVVGMFAAVFAPARQALLPTIIDPRHLVRANGLISGLGIMATMAAAVLSGWLADRFAPQVSFRVNAITFTLSAVCLLLMRLPRRDAPSSPGAATDAHETISTAQAVHRAPRPLSHGGGWRELAAGFAYARHHRPVRDLLIIAAIVWFCGSLVVTVIPAVVRDVYGGQFVQISMFRALLGLGLVLGATLITTLGNALRSEVAITWGLLLISAGLGLFGLSTFLPWDAAWLMRIGAVGVIMSGMGGVTVIASYTTLLQRTTANRFRGRVFGVKELCSSLALLLATGLLGIPGWARVDHWVGYILLGVALLTFIAGWTTLRIRLRRGPEAPLVAFLRRLTEIIARFWWRMERVGPITVPRHGPVILAANHVSPADPLILAVSVPFRMVSYLVAAEYVKGFVIGLFVRASACIPVRRGTREVGATKAALDHLQQGKALAIFIEGGIPEPGRELRPKDGCALLALRTGAPVIPVFLSGMVYREGIFSGLLTRHRARIRFGPPVDLSDLTEGGGRENVRQATQRIHQAIQRLNPSPQPQEPSA